MNVTRSGVLQMNRNAGGSTAHIVVLGPTLPVNAFGRNPWRGGRFPCYARRVMRRGSALNCDFRFSLMSERVDNLLSMEMALG